MLIWLESFDGWRISKPQTFQPQVSTPDLLTTHFSTMNFEKSGIEISFNLLERYPRIFNHELFNPMVQKFIAEKSGVEAWGWKVWGWDVLQPFQTCGTIVEIHQLQSFIQQLIDIFIVPTEPNTFTIAAPFVGTDWFKHISHCELWIKWTIVPLKPFGTWSSTNWSIWVYLNWKKKIVSTSHYEKKFTKNFWCPNILNKLFSSNPYDPLKIPTVRAPL